MTESILTKLATHDDISQMIEVCEENLIENNNEKLSESELIKKGFLIRKLTFADAKEIIDDQENRFAFVLQDDGKTLGYISANDLQKNNQEFQKQVLQSEKLKNSSGKILYYNQIAKRRDAIGVGKNLINAMLDEARNRGYKHVVCQIVHQPFFNEASVNFHKKFGFEEIGQTKDGDRILGIYLRNL